MSPEVLFAQQVGGKERRSTNEPFASGSLRSDPRGIVICVDSERIPTNYLKHNKPPNSAYHVMKKIGYL